MGIKPPTGNDAETIKLSDKTALQYKLTSDQANVDTALREAFGRESYLTFVANVNVNSVEAAFGKGNEDRMFGIGKALAMYAWYKGQDKRAYPFNQLILAQTLKAACEEPTVREIEANDFLTQFLMSYEYSQKELVNKLPVPAAASGAEGVILGCYQGDPFNMATSAITKTFQVTESGIYSLVCVVSGQGTPIYSFTINGNSVTVVPGLYDSLTPVRLSANDTITCTFRPFTSDPTRRGCMFLGAISKLTKIDYEPAAGDVPFYVAKGKSITMPFSGTFYIKASTKTINTGSALTLSITRNDGTVTKLASTNSTDYLTHTLTDNLAHHLDVEDVISFTATDPRVMPDYTICLYADCAYRFPERS